MYRAYSYDRTIILVSSPFLDQVYHEIFKKGLRGISSSHFLPLHPLEMLRNNRKMLFNERYTRLE
jgi:hypothetical protein